MNSNVNNWINKINEKDFKMQIHQFESDEMRRKDDVSRPWRKFAPPVGKPPANPGNPNNNGPINHDKWMKSSKPMEESNEMPEQGDTIRTRKMQMDGKVERIEGDKVYFRIGDGRLMRTDLDNVIVVEKLADEETEMMEQEINEISNALLTKYKSGASKSASSADALGDIKTGNKRFSGIVKATNKQFANDAKARAAKSDMKEGSMGGINRSRPAVDVSYEKVLDRNPETAHSKVVGEQQVNELSIATMQSYKDKAGSKDSFRTRPLRKLAKSSQTVNTVDSKISNKRNAPTAGGLEERLQYFLEADMNQFADILGQQEKETQAAKPKPKPKVIPLDKRWSVRYRSPTKEFERVEWQILDATNSNNPEKWIAHKGTAMSEKDAVRDAEEWVGNRGAGLASATAGTTLDFNKYFLKEISEGNTFYATIDISEGKPVLIYSLEPNESLGLKKSAPRGTDTNLPGVPVSAKIANAAGLVPHARYQIGPREEYSEGTGIYIFKLIFDSITDSKTDSKRLPFPTFTVGTSDKRGG